VSEVEERARLNHLTNVKQRLADMSLAELVALGNAITEIKYNRAKLAQMKEKWRALHKKNN
jgi:hypothetical protein